jgi:hypothetical protein
MSGRVDLLAMLNDPTTFTTKPKKAKAVPEETIEDIARQNNFHSRPIPKTSKEPRRKARTHRTGRNVQFNAKVTPETIDRFYKAANDRHVVLGELMKQALDALEAVDGLQKMAEQRRVSLNEIVEQAIDALDSAGH